jgi:hypothetical protein
MDVMNKTVYTGEDLKWDTPLGEAKGAYFKSLPISDP